MRQAHTFKEYVITIYSMHADGMLTSFACPSRTSICASFAARAPRTQQDQPISTGEKRAGAPCYIFRRSLTISPTGFGAPQRCICARGPQRSCAGQRKRTDAENAKSLEVSKSLVFCPDLLVNLQDLVSTYNQDLRYISIPNIRWSSGPMEEVGSARLRVRALHTHREFSHDSFVVSSQGPGVARVWCHIHTVVWWRVWWGVAWVWYILHHTVPRERNHLGPPVVCVVRV